MLANIFNNRIIAWKNKAWQDDDIQNKLTNVQKITHNFILSSFLMNDIVEQTI